MKFYCGLELSARNSQVCVIDEDVSVVVDKKVRNELPRIINLIEPFKENLKAVVESSFNWYWDFRGQDINFVDRRQETGPE
jgi:hypothetical protein